MFCYINKQRQSCASVYESDDISGKEQKAPTLSATVSVTIKHTSDNATER